MPIALDEAVRNGHIKTGDVIIMVAFGGGLTWERFLERRAALTARMEMETCNGCDGCGLRCMDGFTVSREEWDAVQEYLKTLPAAEVERVRRRYRRRRVGVGRGSQWCGDAPSTFASYCGPRPRESSSA